jgi:hypothetical protein
VQRQCPAAAAAVAAADADADTAAAAHGGSSLDRRRPTRVASGHSMVVLANFWSVVWAGGACSSPASSSPAFCVMLQIRNLMMES